MKKYFAFLFILILPLALTGCRDNSLKNLMSEVTNDYYFADCELYSLSISVGKRENPYLIDGIHNNVVDFSLITLKIKENLANANGLSCKLIVDEKEHNVMLVYNPVANAYMFDLGFALSSKAEIKFDYSGICAEPQLISKDFKVSSSEAIKIAQNMLRQNKEIMSQGEGYLKVVCENGKAPMFWYFSYVSANNKSYNIIISVEDGSILASDV